MGIVSFLTTRHCSAFQAFRREGKTTKQHIEGLQGAFGSPILVSKLTNCRTFHRGRQTGQGGKHQVSLRNNFKYAKRPWQNKKVLMAHRALRTQAESQRRASARRIVRIKMEISVLCEATKRQVYQLGSISLPMSVRTYRCFNSHFLTFQIASCEPCRWHGRRCDRPVRNSNRGSCSWCARLGIMCQQPLHEIIQNMERRVATLELAIRLSNTGIAPVARDTDIAPVAQDKKRRIPESPETNKHTSKKSKEGEDAD